MGTLCEGLAVSSGPAGQRDTHGDCAATSGFPQSSSEQGEGGHTSLQSHLWFAADGTWSRQGEAGHPMKQPVRPHQPMA